MYALWKHIYSNIRYRIIIKCDYCKYCSFQNILHQPLDNLTFQIQRYLHVNQEPQMHLQGKVGTIPSLLRIYFYSHLYCYISNFPIIIAAHFTQFSQIGWRYLKHGEGVGNLTNGGTYTAVTNGKDLSIFIVTLVSILPIKLYLTGIFIVIRRQAKQGCCYKVLLHL